MGYQEIITKVDIRNEYVVTGSQDGGHYTTGATTDPPADFSRVADKWSLVSLLKGILARSGAAPADQLVHGAVSVSNFPAPVADQLVHGPVSVVNFPAPVADQLVHGTVSVSNPVSTVAVSNFPAPVADQLVHGPVSVTNFPAVQTTREVTNIGRAQLCLTWENLAGTVAETQANFTSGSHAGSALISASSYTVPAGKTLRIQALLFNFGQNGSAACNYRVRLRQGSPVGVASPVILGAGTGGPANASNVFSAPIPDGLEIPAGQQIGLTHIDTATGGIWSAYLIGFEY